MNLCNCEARETDAWRRTLTSRFHANGNTFRALRKKLAKSLRICQHQHPYAIGGRRKREPASLQDGSTEQDYVGTAIFSWPNRERRVAPGRITET